MVKSYKVFLGLFGVTDIVIGMLHIIFGPSVIPGSVPVNATMDSEDLFYATLFVGFGVALIWCIRDVEQKSLFIYFLASIFFADGIAGLVSMISVGLPVDFFVAMTLLELMIPLGMVWVQSVISKPRSGASESSDAG